MVVTRTASTLLVALALLLLGAPNGAATDAPRFEPRAPGTLETNVFHLQAMHHPAFFPDCSFSLYGLNPAYNDAPTAVLVNNASDPCAGYADDPAEGTRTSVLGGPIDIYGALALPDGARLAHDGTIAGDITLYSEHQGQVGSLIGPQVTGMRPTFDLHFVDAQGNEAVVYSWTVDAHPVFGPNLHIVDGRYYQRFHFETTVLQDLDLPTDGSFTVRVGFDDGEFLGTVWGLALDEAHAGSLHLPIATA